VREVVLELDERPLRLSDRKAYVDWARMDLENALLYVMNAVNLDDGAQVYIITADKIHQFTVATKNQLRQLVQFIEKNVSKEFAHAVAKLMFETGHDWQWALSYLTGMRYKDGYFERGGLVLPEQLVERVVDHCRRDLQCTVKHIQDLTNRAFFKI
jgi:hypothetical protein